MRELRALQQENVRLKKLLAERDLAIEVMNALQLGSDTPLPDRNGGT